MVGPRVPRPAPLPLSQRVVVETPEHVAVQFELAGLGSRVAAQLADWTILGVLFWLLGMTVNAVGGNSGLGVWPVVIGIVVGFLLTWGYFLGFEALNQGRTPGKAMLGIRVVLETGHQVTFAAAAVRNLIRFADATILPFLAPVFVLLHPQNKRPGDMVAGTIVIRDRPVDVTLAPPVRAAPTAPGAAEPIEAGPPQLKDDEYRLLGQVLERIETLDPARSQAFLKNLAARIGERVALPDPDPLTALTLIYEDERQRRLGRFATRPADGGGAGRTTVAAERFIARKQADWERFRRDAAEVERVGLKELGADAVLAFAARYREVAADLARAHTYDVEPRVQEYLGRVVAAGHNAVYGLRSFRRPPLARLLLREFPAAVFAARAHVLAAMLLFLVPGVVGFALIHEQPEIAYQVLPDEMIARAEVGTSRQAEGIGYAEAPSPFLPVMASGIIANNVQVAFAAFGLGITAGIGTVLVLVSNGLFFGAVVALFGQYHLTGWLLTFVLGHGVLELTAIFIAGGAGLLIAHALVAPGDLTRHDAIIVRGRVAVRLVGAAVCLLVLAGTIEGFLSASDQAAIVKLSVSAASAVLLGLYLLNGWRVLSEQRTPAARNPVVEGRPLRLPG